MRSLSSVRRPRRVLLTTDAVGGVWTHAIDLARGLGALDVETTLAVLGPRPSPAQSCEARSIPTVTLVETDLQLDWLSRSDRELLRTADALTDIAMASRADVAHLHAPAMAGRSRWPLPLVVTAHSCVGTWWEAVRTGPLPPDLEWQVSATRSGLQSAARVIAPSRSFSRTLAGYYRLARIDPILNGRSPVLAGTRAQASRSGVIAAGRLWDPAKGAETLDEAAGLAKVAIAAAGPLIGPNGQSVSLSRVEHLGCLDAIGLAHRMRRAAVFASAAVYEPFGLAVLEAAQGGAALVLSDIPAHRELWDGAALFFPARRADRLAAAIDRLGGDDELRQRLGVAAEKRARRYSVGRMARATAAVYARAAGLAATSRQHEHLQGAGAR